MLTANEYGALLKRYKAGEWIAPRKLRRMAEYELDNSELSKLRDLYFPFCLVELNRRRALLGYHD